MRVEPSVISTWLVSNPILCAEEVGDQWCVVADSSTGNGCISTVDNRLVGAILRKTRNVVIINGNTAILVRKDKEHKISRVKLMLSIDPRLVPITVTAKVENDRVVVSTSFPLTMHGISLWDLLVNRLVSGDMIMRVFTHLVTVMASANMLTDMYQHL